MKDRDDKPLEIGDWVQVSNSAKEQLIGEIAYITPLRTPTGNSAAAAHLRWKDNSISSYSYMPYEVMKIEPEDLL